MFFASPARIISQAAPDARAIISSTCGSIVTACLRCRSSCMGMCPEIQLPTPPIGYVGVKLCGGQVRVAEHLLHRAEVGAAFEQVGGEGMTEQVGVDAVRVETGFLGQLAQDQERAGPGEGATAGVQEELGAVAAVEVRPAA
jgi:hypothetical protein